jgi:hypothetical protein
MSRGIQVNIKFSWIKSNFSGMVSKATVNLTLFSTLVSSFQACILDTNLRAQGPCWSGLCADSSAVSYCFVVSQLPDKICDSTAVFASITVAGQHRSSLLTLQSPSSHPRALSGQGPSSFIYFCIFNIMCLTNKF